MSALYDDEPGADAEVIAQRYMQWRASVQRAIDTHREHYVALATARLAGVDDAAAWKALDDYLASYEPADLELLLDMLGTVLWDGVRSAEREARTRLMALRDARDVTPILEVLR